MNLFFAMFGYRIFTVEALSGTKPDSGGTARLVTFAVLSKRHNLEVDDSLKGWRLGGNVLVHQVTDD
jgi:hypothetical protein